LSEAFTSGPLQDVFALQLEKTIMILLCGCLQITSKFLGFTHIIFGDLENVILSGQAMIEWLEVAKAHGSYQHSPTSMSRQWKFDSC
jgi:hypothetical protein